MQNNPKTKFGQEEFIHQEYPGTVVKNMLAPHLESETSRVSHNSKQSLHFTGPAKIVLAIGIPVLRLIARGIKASISLLFSSRNKSLSYRNHRQFDALPGEEEL